jgi:hypothetical protein
MQNEYNRKPSRYHGGAWWRSGWGTALQTDRSRDRFPVVIGIFHLHNPSGRTVALRSTQPLTDMSTRKGGRCVGLTTLPPSCADCLKLWEPQPPGTLKVCNGIALPLVDTIWLNTLQHWHNGIEENLNSVYLLKGVSRSCLMSSAMIRVQLWLL